MSDHSPQAQHDEAVRDAARELNVGHHSNALRGIQALIDEWCDAPSGSWQEKDLRSAIEDIVTVLHEESLLPECDECGSGGEPEDVC